MAPKGRGYKVTPPRVLELLLKAVAEKSQYAVAKETGLSLSVIQGLIKGNREPSTSTLTKLSSYFDVSVSLLRDDNYLHKSSGGMSTIKPGARVFEEEAANQLEEAYKKYGLLVKDFINKIPPNDIEVVFLVIKDMRDKILIEALKEDLLCQDHLKK
ncbi:MAG: helix-turn-helix transcriptional regulator [Desulfuromonadales bacterium]|nr:helix-turn-helix transcriptional regulator [Desulfuromonadales bacterium]